jgi:hypothetical protein
MQDGRDNKHCEDETDTTPKDKTKRHPGHCIVSLTTLIIICLIVPLLLGGFTNFFAHKTWILYFPLFGVLLLIGYLGHLGIRSLSATKTPPPKVDFSVAVEAGWLHPRSIDENFWLIYGDKNGTLTASPINGLLYIRFTNLGTTSIMIDSYTIEILKEKNEWVRLFIIGANNGEFYNRGPTADMKEAKRDYVDAFDDAIANKDIEPHHTVRGWVFAEAPEGGVGTHEKVRFRIKDILGNEAVQDIGFLSRGESAQSRSFRVGATKDLSQAKKQFYSEARP